MFSHHHEQPLSINDYSPKSTYRRNTHFVVYHRDDGGGGAGGGGNDIVVSNVSWFISCFTSQLT